MKQLVHFNGTTFDLPYLTHKALFYQMEDPLSSIASLDLYQALRPFQSILGLSSMKQKMWNSISHSHGRINLTENS